MYHYQAPLDPDCPENPMESFYTDPITLEYGAEECGELLEDDHRRKCARCRAYGAQNIEVVGP